MFKVSFSVRLVENRRAVVETHFHPQDLQGLALELGKVLFPDDDDDELLPVGEQDCQDPRKICENLIRSKERKREGGVWAIKCRSDKGGERTRSRS